MIIKQIEIVIEMLQEKKGRIEGGREYGYLNL